MLHFRSLTGDTESMAVMRDFMARGYAASIASEHLAQLKAENDSADVPSEEMTPAQYQELAPRYNGRPYWQTDDAQAYGRGFKNNLAEARSALR